MTGLYSPINKLMEQVTRPKGTGAEYMTELQKKPGYKPAEAEDRDLQTLMTLPQMQRAEFMEKLKGQANKYPLKMRELGEGQTHHETYTLPGGENYREILLHTPDTKREELKKKLSDIADLMNSPSNTLEQYKKLYATRAALADQYTHGTEGSFPGNAAHFGGTPNILASVRVKDRTSPEGKKILHIEEIQSDWHQQGREHGYHPKDLYAQIRAATAEKRMMDRYLKEADEDSSGMVYGEYGRMVDDQQAATEKLDRLRQLKEEGVPHGPHAKDWHELALKAMIQHAAENGYDQIAVTPGAEQARRFGLSKHVGAVSYNPETQHFQAFKPNRETITDEKGATPERVKALIGKEATEKLLQTSPFMGHHYLEGQGLDMGGEGMKGFYDKMVPTFLNKFGKKHGVQVQPGAITVPDEVSMGAGAKANMGDKSAPVHTFDITPGMRDDVVKNGIPRYAEGGDVSRETAEANKAKFLKPSVVKQQMYHGTSQDIHAFKPKQSNSVFVTDSPETAHFFAKNSADSKHAGDGQNIMPVHVQVSNPFDYNNLEHMKALRDYEKTNRYTDRSISNYIGATNRGDWEAIESKKMQDALKHLGHDSFYVMENGRKNLGIHDPRKIKSAIGNRGTYDPNEPDITKAKGGSIKPIGHAVVKEKVTISPNMDAMQYELMGVKHFTKKAK